MLPLRKTWEGGPGWSQLAVLSGVGSHLTATVALNALTADRPSHFLRARGSISGAEHREEPHAPITLGTTYDSQTLSRVACKGNLEVCVKTDKVLGPWEAKVFATVSGLRFIVHSLNQRQFSRPRKVWSGSLGSKRMSRVRSKELGTSVGVGYGGAVS